MTRHYLKFQVSVAMATTVHRHLVRHTLHDWTVASWFIVIPGWEKNCSKTFEHSGKVHKKFWLYCCNPRRALTYLHNNYAETHLAHLDGRVVGAFVSLLVIIAHFDMMCVLIGTVCKYKLVDIRVHWSSHEYPGGESKQVSKSIQEYPWVSRRWE